MKPAVPLSLVDQSLLEDTHSEQRLSQPACLDLAVRLPLKIQQHQSEKGHRDAAA